MKKRAKKIVALFLTAGILLSGTAACSNVEGMHLSGSTRELNVTKEDTGKSGDNVQMLPSDEKSDKIFASSVYNNYLSKQGPNAEIYNELGLCEMAKKEYQNALAAFQAGKQIEGNSLMQTLCFNEIVAYEYLEDYQQAEVLMNAYLQNYPDDQTAIREQQFLSTR